MVPRTLHLVARGDALLWRHPVPDHGKPGILWTPDALDLSALHTDSELRPVSPGASPDIARPQGTHLQPRVVVQQAE